MEILFLIFLGLTAYFLIANRSGRSNDETTLLPGKPRAHQEVLGAGRTEQSFKRFVGQDGKEVDRQTYQHGERSASVGFLESLAEASMMAAGTMVAFAAVAVGTVVISTGFAAYAAATVIRSVLDEHRSARPETDAVNERRRRERDVQIVNAQIAEYESKSQRDGHLNEYDWHTLRDFYDEREEKRSLLVAANGLVIADQMNSGTGTYDIVRVTDDKTHILQFHVGQTVFGKVCGSCGRPMVLQWQQHLETVRMRDFFWGCTGFYSRTCRNVERFEQSDMELFTKTDREEFTIPTAQLSSIARSPQAVKMVRRRMDEIVNVGNSTYYCPIHHEPMVLRQKKGAETLRDLFFYGCPRWRPSGPSCKQIVKLKSAAQLSAALETATGRGML